MFFEVKNVAFMRLVAFRKRLLGIKLRGTDYTATKPKYHAKQPTVDLAIRITEEMQKEWGEYAAFFLATEDREIEKTIKEYYKDKVFTIDIHRYNKDETWYKSSDYKKNKKQMGEDYCVEVAMLASCNALIASGSQGTMAAILLNNCRYDHCKVIDLGEY